MHDKKVCDEEHITVSSGWDLYQDSGFQGYEVPGVKIYQPMKKPSGEELAPADRLQNRFISKFRVVIEHIIGGVKRCRIVKDIFRNTQRDYEDTVMELACALHNFRSHCRLTCY